MNINAIKYNELPVNNGVDDKNKKQAEVRDLTKSIIQLSIDENSDSGIVTCDNMYLLGKSEYIEYKTENDNTFINAVMCWKNYI